MTSGWWGLAFPQWQGAGNALPVGAGCMDLAGHWGSRVNLHTVSVEDGTTPPRDGVFALDTLVGQAESVRRMLEEHTPERILMFGGDCSTELIPVSWLNARYGQRLAVVWLDAHADSNSPESSPSGNAHGMPLRILQGEGPADMLALLPSCIGPEQIVLAGVRDTDPAEVSFLAGRQIFQVTVDEINSGGWGRLRKHLSGFDHVYVHLDCDVLEPERFPHVWYRTAAGVEPDRLVALLGVIRDHHDIVGFSLLEYVPQHGGDLGTVDRLVSAATGIRTG